MDERMEGGEREGGKKLDIRLDGCGVAGIAWPGLALYHDVKLFDSSHSPVFDATNKLKVIYYPNPYKHLEPAIYSLFTKHVI